MSSGPYLYYVKVGGFFAASLVQDADWNKFNLQ